MNTYYCDDKCDPHEEIEASEDVVKDLLPVLGRGRTDDIPAVLEPSLNCCFLEANCRMARVTGVHFICTDEVDVDASYGICRICGFFSL
jgi:hypothetical protein